MKAPERLQKLIPKDEPPTIEPDSRDRESVRTTFKLTEPANEAKAALADYWNVSQKEAADYICRTLVGLDDKWLDSLKKLWAAPEESRLEDAIRKTHVISHEAYETLEKMAVKMNVS